MYVSASTCTHNDWNFAAFVLSLCIIILSLSLLLHYLFIHLFIHWIIILFFHYYLFQCSDCPRVEPWSLL